MSAPVCVRLRLISFFPFSLQPIYLPSSPDSDPAATKKKTKVSRRKPDNDFEGVRNDGLKGGAKRLDRAAPKQKLKNNRTPTWQECQTNKTRKGEHTMAFAPINLTSGMRSNLVSLQQTNTLMELTQKKLASGKKVNSALDDPVAYFTAMAHDQRAGDLAGRKDEMSEAVQTVKAADAGIQSINTLLTAAKSLASSALSADGTAAAVLNAQYVTVLSQIDQMGADSGYKGINLLSGTDASLTVKFNEAGVTSYLNIAGFNATSSVGGGTEGTGLSLSTGTAAADWLKAGGTGEATTVADTATINTAISALDTAKETLRTQSSKLANNLSIVTARQEFTQNMINVLKDGAAGLTNADMNEEGANMLMLQTRQQLGTTSLSLASQAAQAVLRLF
jgi:flagellin